MKFAFLQKVRYTLIGITTVLTAVFLPMALSSGSVGALSLTPALCATLLKPVAGHEKKNRFFTWFNDRFDRMTAGYERWVVAVLKRTGRAILVFVAVHRADDFAHRLGGRFLRRQMLLVHDALDILNNDDCIVDDDADRQHHAEHGQHVDREAYQQHHRQRAEQRDRGRDRGDPENPRRCTSGIN